MKHWICMLLAALLLCTAACAPDTALPESEVLKDSTTIAVEESSPIATLEPLTGNSDDSHAKPDKELIGKEEPPMMSSNVDSFTVTDTDHSVNDYADFSYLLGANTLDGKQNQSLSPFSVYLALAMLTEGASGETQAELLRLLGASDVTALQARAAMLLENNLIDGEDSVVDTHNSFWMTESKSFRFRESYVNGLEERYRSETYAEDFTSPLAKQRIADWIKKYTRDTIDPTFELNPTTVSVLVNTLYLKDGWADPFDPTDTEKGDFHSEDGTITVTDFMQNGFSHTTVVQGDGFLRCSLPLARIGSVVLVLPDEDVPLSRLIQNAEALERTMTSGIETDCNLFVRMPKFTFHTRYEMAGLLQALGAESAFTDHADFGNMLETGSVYVGQVIHETYVSMDEKGTEASAYTMITTRGAGALILPVELPRVEMVLDRPFLFAVTGLDGSILFLGTFTEIPQS